MASLSILVSFLLVASASAFDDELYSTVLDRAAPWWEALRDESYYKKCHSSCTEASRGVTTRVELCDDTEVGDRNRGSM